MLVIGVILLFSFFSLVVSILVGGLIFLLLMFVIAQVCGIKVTITNDGIKVGYLRFFRYHSVEDK
jgi:hypothetical protein